MHHGGEAHTGQLGQGDAVLLFHIGGQFRIGRLDTGPHILQMVGPVTALIAVFPAIAAGGHHLVVVVDEHSLDAGGAQLQTQIRAAVGDEFLHLHDNPPRLFLPILQDGKDALQDDEEAQQNGSQNVGP